MIDKKLQEQEGKGTAVLWNKGFKAYVALFLLAVMCILEPASAYAAVKKSAGKEQIPLSELTLSLSFENKPLGQVLATVARLTQASLKNGANFAISPAAATSLVTTEFESIKFKDALSMIAKAAKVSIVEEQPNMFVVRTIAEEEQVDPNMSEKQKEINAMERRISNGEIRTFVLNYVGADDVQEALDELFDEEADSVFSISVLGGDSAGSGGASASAASGSTREYSTVIVYAANKRVMDYIAQAIRDLDRPRPMVEVEAVFVEVTSNNDNNFGITWDIMPTPIEFLEESVGSIGVSDLGSAVPVFHRTGLGTMRRTSGGSVSGALSMTESNSKGKVLSNPRIRVMSGHTAGFSSETQVPIMNKDADGEVDTEYKNVGINLDILPIVLNNDQIYLTVKPSVASITATVTLGDTQAPQIDERSAETTVLMRDNEIMVIGGLLSDRDIKSMSKVPFLWKIPIFGELFKSTTVEKVHSSLSVYIRLRLIRDYMDEPSSSEMRSYQTPDGMTVETGVRESEQVRQTGKDREADLEKIDNSRINALLEGLKKREEEKKRKEAEALASKAEQSKSGDFEMKSTGEKETLAPEAVDAKAQARLAKEKAAEEKKAAEERKRQEAQRIEAEKKAAREKADAAAKEAELKKAEAEKAAEEARKAAEAAEKASREAAEASENAGLSEYLY